jgi:hypothetical protein
MATAATDAVIALKVELRIGHSFSKSGWIDGPPERHRSRAPMSQTRRPYRGSFAAGVEVNNRSLKKPRLPRTLRLR